MEKKVKSKKNQRCLCFICWQAMCWHESSLRYIKVYENRKIVMYTLIPQHYYKLNFLST